MYVCIQVCVRECFCACVCMHVCVRVCVCVCVYAPSWLKTLKLFYTIISVISSIFHYLVGHLQKKSSKYIFVVAAFDLDKLLNVKIRMEIILEDYL